MVLDLNSHYGIDVNDVLEKMLLKELIIGLRISRIKEILYKC